MFQVGFGTIFIPSACRYKKWAQLEAVANRTHDESECGSATTVPPGGAQDTPSYTITLLCLQGKL